MFKNLFNDRTNKIMDLFTDNGFEIRFVGGCVRDSMLGKKPKDIDFCTDATPDQMMKIAKKAKYHFIATGLDHGTITIMVDGEGFEITTLRSDDETDGRHASVSFVKSFEIDAERRDFTFNAMSVDPQGNLHDYFGGEEDLKKNRIRFVGDTEKRIKEDFLRVLRYFRFAARFNSDMDEEVISLFGRSDILDGISKLSYERVWGEMTKILDPKMPGRSRIVDAIYRSRVNRAIDLFRFNPTELAFSDDYLAAMSTLIDSADAFKFLKSHPFSNFEKNKIANLIKDRDVDYDERMVREKMIRSHYRMGESNLYTRDIMVSNLKIHNKEDLAEFAEKFVIPLFNKTGNDIIAEGVNPGPEVGKVLRAYFEDWLVEQL